MSYNSGQYRGGWFPRFYRAFRPREIKNYGIMEDFQTPTLQFGGAFVVQLVNYLMAMSWAVISPPIVPWLIGMIAAILGPAVAFTYAFPRYIAPALVRGLADDVTALLAALDRARTDYSKLEREARQSGGMDRRIQANAAYAKYSQMGPKSEAATEMLEERSKSVAIAGLTTAAVIGLISSLFAYFAFWDWWEAITYSFCGLPKFAVEGLTFLLPLGIAIILFGVVFTIWKPSKYTFGLQVFGAAITIATWFLRPVTVRIVRGGVYSLTSYDAICYGTWACVCVAWWLASASYLKRMHTEMRDDMPYEHAALYEDEDDDDSGAIRFVRGPYHANLPPPAPPQPQAEEPTLRTHNGQGYIHVTVRDFCEVLSHMTSHGLGQRDVIHPKWRTKGGTLISQHAHWRAFVWPLEQAGVYDRDARKLNPDFEPFNPLQVLEVLGLEMYKDFLREA